MGLRCLDDQPRHLHGELTAFLGRLGDQCVTGNQVDDCGTLCGVHVDLLLTDGARASLRRSGHQAPVSVRAEHTRFKAPPDSTRGAGDAQKPPLPGNRALEHRLVYLVSNERISHLQCRYHY
ncbi:MAG: hypothetical protein EXR82_03435 [Gammaproteobacteria bacterium]|nr:hypothetical protein [Gammaproteobacteria bacterium]